MWIATVKGRPTLLYSYNGIVWVSIPNVSGDSAGCIKWTGTMWVAAGRSYGNDSTTVTYSYNGVDWFAAPSIKYLTNVRGFSFIEWNGTIWIGGGKSNSEYIWVSYDGINWILTQKSTGQNDEPFSASWDGNRWIMCCGNKTDTSVNGINWTTNNTTDVGNIIKFTGSLWLLGSSNAIKYSLDGINWTSVTITGSVQCIETNISKPYNVSITPSVIGCGNGFTAITENGRKWRNIYDAKFTKIVSSPNGLIYVATGSSTATHKLSYSYDLNNWTGLGSTIFGASGSGNGLACNGSMWIAVGAGTNTIAYSYNGITWTGLGTSIFSTAGNSVEWNGSMWVAVGAGTNTIATSTDGITWTGRGATILTTIGNSVAWNGNMWLAVGQGTSHNIATSTDGIAWTGQNKPGLGTSGNGIAWNGKLWIAVGEGTNVTIMISPDGINWESRGKTIFSDAGYSVVWNGTMFIASGKGTNTVAISYDGVTWVGFGTTIFPSSDNVIKLSVLNNGFTLNSYGITGTQNLEINPGTYMNNTNNLNINIQGISLRKT